MRLNRSKFETSNIEKLQIIADKPKEFWNHVKKLNKRNNLNSNNIPSDVWVEHFSNLNRKEPANDPQSQEY